MTYLVTKKVTQDYTMEIEANSEAEAIEQAESYGNDWWNPPDPNEFEETYEAEPWYHERFGEYINVYDDAGKYDVFVILSESEEPVTQDKIDKTSKIVRSYLNDVETMKLKLGDLFPWGFEIK